MNAHATIEPETDRIARLADCFEGAWRNEEPDLAVYLALVSHASSRRALLRRLIAIDARAKKSRGRTVDPRDYGPLAAATPDVTIEAIASWIAETTVETTDDGCLVAPYTLIREIGAGSFGRVYLMTQAVTNRSVAVKVLTHWGDRKDEARLRFHREAEALGRVQHPNVVKVYEFSIFPPGFEPLPGGSYYLAMEYCPHGSLASQLTHAPAADPDAVAKSTALLARGLAAAHERGVLHRDISTNNILIAADGSYKLADFGLAKFANDDGQWTASAGVLGTPVYAAPEQLNGSAEMASDVYALGAVLFRWLTGKEPFRGTLTEILAQKTEVETAFPVPSTVPRDLQAICLKCLEKDPRSRYASAADLADDLTRHVEGETVHARWGNAVSRLTRALRRNRLDGQYEGWAPWLLVIALVGGLHNALVWYCRWNEWPDLYLAVGFLSWGIRLIVFVWGFLVTRGEAKVQERQIFWILVGNTFACTALTFSTISDRSSLLKSHAWSDFAPVHLWCISNAFCCFVLAIAPYKLRWLFIGTAAFLGAAATTIRFPDMALLTFGFAWFISFGTGAIFIWARKRRRSRSNLILSGRRSTR